VAIYHLNMKSIGRAAGSSSVGAAAYRAGERIRDERTGRTYDHSDRQDVLHKEIMLPRQFAADEMSWARDRGNLWNSAERAEVRIDARTAREYMVALPAELSPQARIELVRGFSRELVERYRFALDIAIHAPRNYRDSDPRNFHAHLLATTREPTPAGLGAKTALEWSDTHRRQMGLGSAVGELLYVREHWATAANKALEKEHINVRIDHRTLKAQGIDREPKPHIPRAAFEMERHGYRSMVAERIRADYQARIEARHARAAQHEQPVARKSLVNKAKEYAMRWLGHTQQPHHQAQTRSPQVPAKQPLQRGLPERPAHKVEQRESPRDPAMEAALRWKAKYHQVQHKSPEDMAKESAVRWHRYREAQLQEHARGKAPGKKLAQERELQRGQNGPDSTSAGRTRDRGLDLSL
jgi:MobA/MobL family